MGREKSMGVWEEKAQYTMLNTQVLSGESVVELVQAGGVMTQRPTSNNQHSTPKRGFLDLVVGC